MPVIFPSWARLALGLLVALIAYLVGGELNVSEELRGALSALAILLGSVGVVPPTAADLPALSPQLRFALTALVTAGGYVVNVLVDVDPTLRGVIVAALALAASVGIVPPQAKPGA